MVARERIDDGRKPHTAGSVIDGLPFVLVSHGPNGRYAVNHWATLRNRTRGHLGFLFPICNISWLTTDTIGSAPDIPAGDIVQHFETANAARVTPGPFNLLLEDGGSCVHTLGIFGEQPIFYNTNAFVWQPPGIGDRSDFDDLLLWSTRGELTGKIRGNIPRLPHMQIAYFPPDFP